MAWSPLQMYFLYIAACKTTIKALTDHHRVCDAAMLISKHKYANVFPHFNKAAQEKEQKGVLRVKGRIS